MSEVSFPPAPILEGELILDVFLHPSLRQDGLSGDNERYRVLGEQAMQAAVTHAICRRFPKHRGDEIMEERSKQLSDENYERWTNYYRFREKLRYPISATDEVHSPKGARDLFHAYVGGVYTLPNGPLNVNDWVFNLIAPPEEPRVVVKTEDSVFFNPPPPASPYPMAPPPPPPPPPFPRTRTGSISGRQGPMLVDENYSGGNKVVYLPRFNEKCTQHRYNVQYPAEQAGLQHAPRWIVNCIVDGVHRGQGTATTKQLAKEDAAKQAWFALGWGMP